MTTTNEEYKVESPDVDYVSSGCPDFCEAFVSEAYEHWDGTPGGVIRDSYGKASGVLQYDDCGEDFTRDGNGNWIASLTEEQCSQESLQISDATICRVRASMLNGTKVRCGFECQNKCNGIAEGQCVLFVGGTETSGNGNQYLQPNDCHVDKRQVAECTPTDEDMCTTTGFPLADAEAMCANLETCAPEMYQDCVFDVCATGGDPAIPALTEFVCEVDKNQANPPRPPPPPHGYIKVCGYANTDRRCLKNSGQLTNVGRYDGEWRGNLAEAIVRCEQEEKCLMIHDRYDDENDVAAPRPLTFPSLPRCLGPAVPPFLGR